MWFVLAVACVYPRTAFGQVEPTAADSAGVRAVMLETLISPRETLDLETFDRRIWLKPTRLERRRFSPHSEEILSHLKERVPTLEAVGEDEPLYVCASGEQVRTSTRGCMVRDDGYIVRLTVERIEGDTAWAGGSLSATAIVVRNYEGRVWTTWTRAMGARLIWDSEKWILDEITYYTVAG
jgi:hypothetical protein